MQLSTAYIHEKGKRTNNEDNYWIESVRSIYMVCDGVGGNSKGEVASSLLINSFQESLKSSIHISKESIIEALSIAEQNFDKHIIENISCEGMATTFTFLHLSEMGGIIAHAGDSRVYHIRDNKVIFQTRDDSLVQTLIDGGYIKEEDAKRHPLKSRITKAIKGTAENTTPSFHYTKEIQPNDYFFLCTDGILESISNNFIVENFTANMPLEVLKDNILQKCLVESKDNFTAILIKVINLKS